MAFPVAAGIAAGAGIVSGLMGNRARGREAQKNRDFQERMRNTEWQAGVADMEKAGLNPALAYQQGGASSPTGAVANMENVGENAVGTAMAVRIQQEQYKLLEAQKAKTMWESQTARAESNMASNREAASDAERSFYFGKDGTLKPEMAARLAAEHAGRLGSSAQQVAAAQYTQYTVAEQRMMSNLFESMGEGGAGAKTFGPMLIALMRAKGGGR